jgi:predicted nucleotidyltransferase
MNSEPALNILRGLQAPLAAPDIAHAAIFGSVARRKENALSDIDIFVKPAEGGRPDLFDLGGVQTILEEAFGSEVDVVVSPVRNGEIRAAIARDRADAF